MHDDDDLHKQAIRHKQILSGDGFSRISTTDLTLLNPIKIIKNNQM
jgi:hypothetical protein